MRRLFISLTALGLLGAAVGCHHTAGVCDCDPGPYHNGYIAPVPAHNGHIAPAPIVGSAEPIRVMPKEGAPR